MMHMSPSSLGGAVVVVAAGRDVLVGGLVFVGVAATMVLVAVGAIVGCKAGGHALLHTGGVG